MAFNSPAPLKYGGPPLYTRRPGSAVIDATWARLEKEAIACGGVSNMRMAYVAALYAASAAINVEGADAYALSQAAEKLEAI